ncbi:uncharacterized protein LOC107834302 [Poecilia formosa]|uniref:uncharacterized protein LOC107834302 n=1 Tax=Poecilia formosa TaxID=48698 RepID=UPI0007B9B692|nr:PREDICTED: uncharacterized protein LOC107834302 [Poecilia formosa]
MWTPLTSTYRCLTGIQSAGHWLPVGNLTLNSSGPDVHIAHMYYPKDKMELQLALRLEQVRRFEGEIPSELVPRRFFCISALRMHFVDNALVIPFEDSGRDSGLMVALRMVFQYFVESLEGLYSSNEGVTRYDACWKSYQFELALEELFYVRTLSPSDFQLSVSLGTNTVNLTHRRGFIGLAPHSAASAGEVPPPLHHWTCNALQTVHLERIFPVCQVLEAVPAVLGAALIHLLL